jgi:hypothetical protein
VADQRRDYGDLALYALSAIFAGVTALTSTLTPHRVWGQISFFGYAVAAIIALFRTGVVRRAGLTIATWIVVAWLPLILEASALPHRQEEVTVVERAGARLLETGTPYLSRSSIAALPVDERLLGYAPYQPGMAVFGLPRAVLGSFWLTDARIWFGLATVACLVTGYRLLAGFFVPARLLRILQAVTVLPLCALTLATGGDDIPVLALSLLAFAYAARDRWTAAGVAIGLAGALKLFAWPVAVVLLVLAWRRSSSRFRLGVGAPVRAGLAAPARAGLAAPARAGLAAPVRFGLPALGIPILVLVPALLIDAGAFVENVIRFPGGNGLVTSPAQSPLLGRVIATTVPGGHAIALGLLVASGLAIAVWLIRRPPRTAADAALVSAVGLTAAIVLNPTTRFGYLLYPVAYVATWYGLSGAGAGSPDAGATGPVAVSRDPASGRTQDG